MGKSRKTASVASKQKLKEVPLFRVWNLETGRDAYLSAGDGLPEAEAQRLSDGLAAETRIYKVYEPDTDE